MAEAVRPDRNAAARLFELLQDYTTEADWRLLRAAARASYYAAEVDSVIVSAVRCRGVR